MYNKPKMIEVDEDKLRRNLKNFQDILVLFQYEVPGAVELLQTAVENLKVIVPVKYPRYIFPKCENCGYGYSTHQRGMSYGHIRSYSHLLCPAPNTGEYRGTAYPEPEEE